MNSPTRILCAALMLLAAACTTDEAPLAHIEGGAIRGGAEQGVVHFLSIPYAAPPVGALRWRAPQPLAPWRGVRDATAFGPSCVQNISDAGFGPWTGEFSPQGAVSEDCLTLSVWAPAHQSGAHLPVMFWIPGGGFTDGGEATVIYNGAAFARRGVIVVAINYRVVAFGLLAHRALQPEPDGANGNYTLRDTLAALRWVHNNIAAFGGDAARVTIAGQSAGAALAYILLDAPQASGLFRAAILQSFPPGSETLPDRAAARAHSEAFAQALHATTAEQLRAAPAADVLRASGDDFNLYVDDVLIRSPYFAAPPFRNDVPIMMGVTADEGSWLRPNLASHRRDSAQNGDAFAHLYPAANDAEALDASLRATREGQLVGLQRFARAHAAPTFLYLWDHTLPGPNADRYRAFHSSEVIYQFGSFAAAPQRPFTPADHAISDAMLSYWANFVKTGNPNGDALAAWPVARGDAPAFMELGDRFGTLPSLAPEVSTFWNAHDDAHHAYVF